MLVIELGYFHIKGQSGHVKSSVSSGNFLNGAM